jgi:TRAP-type C4-dicarboxylate transport system substrate-binding protein
MLARFAAPSLAAWTVLVVATAAASAMAPAHAEDKPIALKLAHWVQPSHPLHKAMQEWGDSISQASGGTITYAVFPAQQLGKAFDHYDMARDGIADVTYINPGYQPGRFPIIAAGELPFLVSNAKGGSEALDAFYRKYAAAEMKDVKFCLGFVHDPGSFHSRSKMIKVPGDIAGMKIRPAQATMAAFVTHLGGTNVQSSAPEVREILEKGVADAVTFPWGSVPLFGIDKVTKYHMEVPLYVTTFAWVLNKAVYEAMSPTQRKVIDAHCTNEWALKVAAPWADFEAGGHAKLKADPNHVVYPISAEELAAWRQAAEPLKGEWANAVRRAGVDPDAAMAELRSELDKFQAAY